MRQPTIPLDPDMATEKPAKPRRQLDPELQAMAKIEAILSELDDLAAARVLTWILQRTVKRTLVVSALREIPFQTDTALLSNTKRCDPCETNPTG